MNLLEERKCIRCGASLSKDAVMKMQFQDGSWETIQLSLCPACFKMQMLERAKQR